MHSFRLSLQSASTGADPDSSWSDQHRALVPLDVLKREKVVAGSWVALTVESVEHTKSASNAAAIVPAQLWPSTVLEDDEIHLSSTHILSLFPDSSSAGISSTNSSNSKLDLNGARSSPNAISVTPLNLSRDTTKVAKTIRLTPVSADAAASVSREHVKAEATREVGWDEAMLRERLMTQKYLSVGMIFNLCPPGPASSGSGHTTHRTTLYRISEIIPSTKVGAGGSGSQARSGTSTPIKQSLVGKARDPRFLEEQLQNLSVGSPAPVGSEVYAMNWRSEIVFDSAVDSASAGSASSEQDGPKVEPKMLASQKKAKTLPPSALPSYVQIYPPSQISQSDSAYSSLGGLAPQVKQVRSLLDIPLSNPTLYTRFGLLPPRGILLYGPPGTGKTHLSRAIAGSIAGCSCIVVNGPELSSAFHGETEERIRAVFEEAERREPCVIVLDEVDAICPRREGGEGGGGEVERRVVAMVLTLMDGMSRRTQTEESGSGDETAAKRVVVIAATNRPNAIDPALRRPGRFDREIEIGIPNARARLEILQLLLAKMPNTLNATDIRGVADKCHGYVGADIAALVREAGSKAIHRWIAQNESGSSTDTQPYMSTEDLVSSLADIRPSAMREIFLEPPRVPWSAIGGQAEVKQKLKECVEWPLTRKHVLKRLGVEAPRGVLLYGPPGCSKTLMAKALATEGGLNFMAVKGPELLNKFVGESERALREVFRKARAASPSIVFFDEIDSLASSRGEGHSNGVGEGILTSLLNEMDGIEEIGHVIVVAATNRPEIIDPALLRPGRLDRILYVGPPDKASRKEIFKIRFSGMQVESGVDIDELVDLSDGCSGAEIASITQDAALQAMTEEEDAQFVKKHHLVKAASEMRRRITPEMLQGYEAWRDASGVRSA